MRSTQELRLNNIVQIKNESSEAQEVTIHTKPQQTYARKQRTLVRPLILRKVDDKESHNRQSLLGRIERDRKDLDKYFNTLKAKKPEPPPAATESPGPAYKRDSYDLFFESACASIKSLPPKLAAEAKSRISQIITEFELRAINEAEQQQQQVAVRSKYGNNETDIVYKFQAYS